MDLAVAADKGASFQLVGGSGFVSECPAGLSYQEQPRGDVPRFDAGGPPVLPVGIKATTCEPGEVEGSRPEAPGSSRAHHHLLHHPQIGTGMVLPVVGETSDDERIVQTGRVRHMDRCAVERCTFTLDCYVLLVSGDVDDYADQWSTVIPQSDRNRDMGNPVHVVDSSVEWVNDPDPPFAPTPPSTFLTKNLIFWEVDSDHRPYCFLGITVHLGDWINRTLEFRFERLEEPGLYKVGAGPRGTHSYPNIAFPHLQDSICAMHTRNPIPTLPSVKAVLLAAAGAVVSVLAFPPYGPGWLILVGTTAFLTALRLVETRKQGLAVGAVYGFIFFGWLLSWLAQLELIALILVPVEAVFFVVYGWWLVKYNKRSPGVWLTLAVGGWALMELIRYQFPTGGFEWGAVGYALSDVEILADPAPLIGGSGLTVLVVLVCGLGAVLLTKRWEPSLWWVVGLVGLVTVLTVVTRADVGISFDGPIATIVQGSTPCPYEHCPPNERLGTYQQHLDLTKTLEENPRRWLTVWSEGSTGSTNADPVLNPEVGDAIGGQARRLDSWMLVGSDRPVSETEWVNVNVVFDHDGKIVGEYRKQHPVPFGEYIPLRPLFEWIPALDRVPRDMVPGDGPVVFDTGDFKLGSVISFEAAFSRYALQHRRAGADVIVVATNEASYGPDAATSDQLIGMSQMRSRELGVPVIHAAVTGKSTIIGSHLTTGLGTREIFEEGHFIASPRTIYSYTGNLVMYLAAILAVLMWWRTRSLVGSDDRIIEEE